MRGEKFNSAERLLDAIGDIDARFIAEAERAPKIKKKPFILPRRAMTIAASAIAFAFVIFGVSRAFLNVGLDADMAPEAENIASEDVSASITLSDVVMSAQNDTKSYTFVSAEDIRFFDDRIKIIWCYEGSEKYYVVRVPLSKENELMRAIEDLKNAKKTNETTDLPYAIWICFEDGRVITPYLEYTEGNVWYGELFEYSPEIEPSSAFTELINELIS